MPGEQPSTTRQGGDWSDNAAVEEWFDHVRMDLVPKLQNSAVTVSIVPERTDPKFAVELGMSIMLDKPIVLIARLGVDIPAKLLKVADAVVDDHGDMAAMSARPGTSAERLGRE